MFAHGPNHHLTSTGNSEKQGSNGTCHDSKGAPSSNFKGVIGTAHVFEQETARNLSFFGTRGSQIGQNDVTIPVAKFKNLQNNKHVWIIQWITQHWHRLAFYRAQWIVDEQHSRQCKRHTTNSNQSFWRDWKEAWLKRCKKSVSNSLLKKWKTNKAKAILENVIKEALQQTIGLRSWDWRYEIRYQRGKVLQDKREGRQAWVPNIQSQTRSSN